MNKKVLACLVVVLVAVIVGFGISNKKSDNNSNNSDENTTISTSDSEKEASNNTEEKTTSSNDDSNNSNDDSKASDSNEGTNEGTNEVIDIDAAAKAVIAKTPEDAVKKLLDFYLGEEDSYNQNTVKVKITKGTDNSVTISKTDEDSNTYYSGSAALSDTTTEGLIITIDNYDENTKTFTYTLKNFTDVKSGTDNNILDSGKIPEEGNVISDKIQSK